MHSDTDAIRTAYSDTARIWHQLPELGIDEDHCTIAPLSGDSVMAVYAGQSGLAWASTAGTTWTASGVLDRRAFVPAHPRLRIRPSGGLWLMWTTRRWVHVSNYRDGLWSRGDSMVCPHNPGDSFDSGWCDASRDTAERPVLVWGDLGSNATFRDVGCIAFPTSTGWGTPEEIPGSGLAVIPTVARDRDGDAWVSWFQLGVGGLYYTHTYCSVTAAAPSVSPSGHGRSVEWELSGPAPGSWWTIERAGSDGDFAEIGRVQADSSASVSFLDNSPIPGVARYRVVRESVDSRYRWYSPAGQFPARSRKSFALEVSPQPFLQNSALTVHSGTPGTMRLTLYDVQGRIVQQRSVELSGADTESLPLGDLIPGRLVTGMYFVIGTDASGARSEPGRIVVIR
ncbi:MAG TPA: T9SS type A sorting domain-containing protein [Gemmatimonadales bacterium]|nr:T9SS type A sorting domain-containing protein [Gemmatimonadales bacterium]